jgi:hypothetical protein
MHSIAPLLLTVLLLSAVLGAAAEITIENEMVRWTIGDDGKQRSFVVKPTGTDVAAAGDPFPLASIHDARGWHQANSLVADGERWVIGFLDEAGSIELLARAEPDHIHLELAGDVPDGVDRVIFAQTSLTIPSEALGRMWPMGRAEGLHIVFAALSPFVRTSCSLTRGTVFSAEAVAATGFENIRLAMLTTRADKTLEHIEALELRYGLPHLTLGGVWFRNATELRQPYLFTDLTETNVDEVIEFANRGGFGYVLVFAGVWSASNGHYEPNLTNYPNGLSGLKEVSDRLHASGLKLGIHLLSACISRHDPYISPVPDRRLAVAKTFQLTQDMDEEATEVPVDVSPAGMTKVDSYDSRGVDLWIDDEIISYGDYATGEPFRFVECRRGRYGTNAAAHKAGATVGYLQRVYDFFLPDTDTDLLPEIAERIAAICNQCEVDMIYFDGGEAINRLEREWHDANWIHREVVKRLDREVLITGSGGTGGFGWHTHMRGNSNDGVNIATKTYMDRHKIPDRVAVYGRNLRAAELGWLNLRAWDAAYPATQPDEWEYFCLKALAYDSPVSLHMHTSNFRRNGRAGECLDIIRRYEQARTTGNFPPDLLSRLCEPGKEFELLGDPETGWQFRPIQYGPTHLACSDDAETLTWQVENPFGAQPVSLRLRARTALRPYGHEENVVLFDPTESVEWDPAGMGGAACRAELSTEVAREDAPSLKLTGRTTRASPSSRAWVRREFAERLDLLQHRSIGLWVHGDGNGEVLDVQIVDASLIRARDYLVHVDFVGWRFCRIVDAATEETFDYQLWRHKGNLTGFHFGAVRELRLQLVAIPVDKEVTVHIGQIEALREIPDPLVDPNVEVNGQALSLRATLEADDLLELSPDGSCRIYGRDNKEKGQSGIEAAPPTLAPGQNTLAIELGRGAPYAYVTPILRGDL